MKDFFGKDKLVSRLIMFMFAFLVAVSLGVVIGWAGELDAVPCPKTQMINSCLTCHATPDFKLKEIRADGHLDYPAKVVILDYGKPTAKGYYELNDVDNGAANQIRDYFLYLQKHNVIYSIIDIFSNGGSLFAGWKIKGLIDVWKAEGKICETVTNGIAASAAAIVFVAGSDGYRTMNSRAELMLHELWTLKLLSIESPSDKEDEARILRHLQDTITSWLAKRSKLTKDELDSRMKKKEFWLNGFDAKQCGFADRVIGD